MTSSESSSSSESSLESIILAVPLCPENIVETFFCVLCEIEKKKWENNFNLFENLTHCDWPEVCHW